MGTMNHSRHNQETERENSTGIAQLVQIRAVTQTPEQMLRMTLVLINKGNIAGIMNPKTIAKRKQKIA